MQQPKQPKRKANEGFWKTAKGRAILAAREVAYERQAWRGMESRWG